MAADGVAAPRASIVTPRNLINVGIFTALYYAALAITVPIGLIHPALMFVGSLLGLLINAIVCMLYIAKTRAPGAYTLMGLIVGLLMLINHPWITIIISTSLGAAADAVAYSGRYTRTVTNALSYAVFSVWMISPLLPILWASDEYFANLHERMDSRNADYATTFQSIFTVPHILIWAGVVFAFSFGAGLVGVRIFRKHFVRAGVA